MSKSNKPSKVTSKDIPDGTNDDQVEETVVEEVGDEESDGKTLGVAKKTKAERDAEKAEAQREAERETLRRRQTPQAVKLDGGKNPSWWVPTMLGLMVIGLIWLVVYYLSFEKQLPVPALGQWNMGVGFAFIMTGFIMTTRWK